MIMHRSIQNRPLLASAYRHKLLSATWVEFGFVLRLLLVWGR